MLSQIFLLIAFYYVFKFSKELFNNDLFGLIYYLIYENNFKVDEKIFYKKNKFKGKIGIFEINKNKINHVLNFYKIEEKKFKKIF